MGVLVAEHIGNNCASTAEAISASAVGVSHTSRRKVELLERNAGIRAVGEDMLSKRLGYAVLRQGFADCPLPPGWRHCWDDGGQDLFIHEFGAFAPQRGHPLLAYFHCFASIADRASIGDADSAAILTELNISRRRIEEDADALNTAWGMQSNAQKSEAHTWQHKDAGWITSVHPAAASAHLLTVLNDLEDAIVNGTLCCEQDVQVTCPRQRRPLVEINGTEQMATTVCRKQVSCHADPCDSSFTASTAAPSSEDQSMELSGDASWMTVAPSGALPATTSIDYGGPLHQTETADVNAPIESLVPVPSLSNSSSAQRRLPQRSVRDTSPDDLTTGETQVPTSNERSEFSMASPHVGSASLALQTYVIASPARVATPGSVARSCCSLEAAYERYDWSSAAHNHVRPNMCIYTPGSSSSTCSMSKAGAAKSSTLEAEYEVYDWVKVGRTNAGSSNTSWHGCVAIDIGTPASLMSCAKEASQTAVQAEIFDWSCAVGPIVSRRNPRTMDSRVSSAEVSSAVTSVENKRATPNSIVSNAFSGSQHCRETARRLDFASVMVEDVDSSPSAGGSSSSSSSSFDAFDESYTSELDLSCSSPVRSSSHSATPDACPVASELSPCPTPTVTVAVPACRSSRSVTSSALSSPAHAGSLAAPAHQPSPWRCVTQPVYAPNRGVHVSQRSVLREVNNVSSVNSSPHPNSGNARHLSSRLQSLRAPPSSSHKLFRMQAPYRSDVLPSP